MAGTKLTFDDIARMGLAAAEYPVDRKELWALIVERGWDTRLVTQGKTPWETLAARLYVDIRDNEKSEFMGVGRRPVRFWLKSRQLPRGWDAEGPSDKVKTTPAGHRAGGLKSKSLPYKERELHPLVAHFAFEKLGGVRVRTINHQVSKKKQFGEWVHPDVVGVLFPMTALGEKATVDFGFAIQAPIIRLYSFELKREVHFGNLRECFFQAVSNSSWAHEGYLVAAQWNDDAEFKDELTRLSQAFGIGAIALDLEDPSSGEVLLPARSRDDLDWSTLDKLVAMNSDVREFLDSVRIDLGARKVHPSEYDEVPADPARYAAKLLGNQV